MFRPLHRSLLLCLLASLAFYACSIPEKPVTKDEAARLAQKISHSIEHRNPVVMDNIFDVSAFSKKVEAASSKVLKKETMQGAVEGMKNIQYGQQIIGAIGEKGSYQLVKQYEKDNKQHLLFRLYTTDGSINYHDFELIRQKEEIKASDVYVYMTGEDLSKTFGETLEMMERKMSDMSASDKSVVGNMKTIKELMARKDFQGAQDAYNALPRDVQREKAFQMLHVQITSELGNDVYQQAMEEYKNLFPNDPNMCLIGIDAYVLQKDYAKALASVNKLDSLIDKDPFLDYYRGLMYKLMLDTAHTRICMERLRDNIPAFGGATTELVVLYATESAPDKAGKLLKQGLQNKLIDTLTAEQIFVAFPSLRKASE